MTDRIVEAQYTKSRGNLYRGNHFIEALPPIMSPNEAFDALAYAPRLPTAKQRALPKHLKIHELQALRLLVRPLNDYVEFESKFAMMLRNGYVSRKLSPKNWQLTYTLAAHRNIRNKRSLPRIDNTAYGLIMYGLSGDGKTTLINRITAIYPETIIHRDLDGPGSRWTQIPCIMVAVPPGGSIIGLCLRILAEIARIVGDPQVAVISPHAGISEHLENIKSLVRKYFIGVIIIDELQHLVEANPAHRKAALNFITDLIEIAGVPVLCVGTYAVQRLFREAFKTVRKAAGLGRHRFYHPTNATDPQWKDLVDFVWPYQWLKTYQRLTPAIRNELFVQTMGITDVLIKFYLLAQLYAISGTHDEKITVPIIREIANRELSILQPALNILRRAKLDDLRPEDAMRYDDLLPAGEWFDEEVANVIRRGQAAHAEPTKKRTDSSVKAPNETVAASQGDPVKDLRALVKDYSTAYEDLKTSNLVISHYGDIT